MSEGGHKFGNLGPTKFRKLGMARFCNLGLNAFVFEYRTARLLVKIHVGHKDHVLRLYCFSQVISLADYATGCSYKTDYRFQQHKVQVA